MSCHVLFFPPPPRWTLNCVRPSQTLWSTWRRFWPASKSTRWSTKARPWAATTTRRPHPTGTAKVWCNIDHFSFCVSKTSPSFDVKIPEKEEGRGSVDPLYASFACRLHRMQALLVLRYNAVQSVSTHFSFKNTLLFPFCPFIYNNTVYRYPVKSNSRFFRGVLSIFML